MKCKICSGLLVKPFGDMILYNCGRRLKEISEFYHGQVKCVSCGRIFPIDQKTEEKNQK